MYKIYQVENSETLESIANKLNTDVETLKKINGINFKKFFFCKLKLNIASPQ